MRFYKDSVFRMRFIFISAISFFILMRANAGYTPGAATLYDVANLQINNMSILTAPNSNNWVDIAYGADGGIFCAVSDTTGTAAVMNGAQQGTSWAAGTTPANSKLLGVGYSPNIQKFIAAGYNDSTGDALILTSSNQFCSSFSSQTIPSPSGSAYRDVTSNSSITVAVGSVTSGNTCKIIYSTNLTSWTTASLSGISCSGLDGFFDVVWSGTKFVAVGPAKAATSTDGINWTVTSMTNQVWSSVAWNGKIFVAGGGSGGAAVSSDGVTWSYNSPTYRVDGVMWTGLYFVAVDYITAGAYAQYSINGKTWKSFPLPFTATTGFATDGYGLIGSGTNVPNTSTILRSLRLKF